MSKAFRMTAEEVALAIKVPLDQWPGNCFGIAEAMVKAGLVDGTAVYGHWIGPISPRSMFQSRRGLGFCHHGWVLLKDEKTVVDPTRYVFESRQPYIFQGVPEMECPDFEAGGDDEDYVCVMCGHVQEEHSSSGFFRDCMICRWPYDEGGNKLLASRQPEPPEFAGVGSPLALDHKAQSVVRTLLGSKLRTDGMLSQDQCHWLAHVPFEDFDGQAHEIYTALTQAGHGAFVPLDNRRRAARGSSSGIGEL